MCSDNFVMRAARYDDLISSLRQTRRTGGGARRGGGRLCRPRQGEADPTSLADSAHTRRILPLSSSCIMPCLRLRALASFTSKETISASMSERTVAMAAWRALPIGKKSSRVAWSCRECFHDSRPMGHHNYRLVVSHFLFIICVMSNGRKHDAYCTARRFYNR